MCTKQRICEAADRAINRAVGVINVEALAALALTAARQAGDTDESLDLILRTHAEVVSAHRIKLYREMPEPAVVRILAHGLWPQDFSLLDLAERDQMVEILITTALEVFPHKLVCLRSHALEEINRRFREEVETPLPPASTSTHVHVTY